LYKNEDEDELSFEAGELIYVMPFDDPDDQVMLKKINQTPSVQTFWYSIRQMVI